MAKFEGQERRMPKIEACLAANGLESLDACRDMLLEKGVAVVPGIAFGDDECVRLSYAISKEDIATGLDRIEEFVKEVF